MQVIRYLEAYHKVSSWAAYSGKITDITLSEMTITCDSGTFKTKFDPAMTSLKDARERLVLMDKDCVKTLGRSDITVRELGAGRREAIVTSVLLLTYLEFSSKSNFAPDGIFSFLPDSIRTFCYNYQPYVLYGLLGVHTFETLTCMIPRLKKHNVNPRSSLYWKWIADCMCNGFGAWKR